MSLSTEERNRFAQEYARIHELGAGGEKATLVREGGQLFEELCKSVASAYLPKVEYSVRRQIIDAETKIGKGAKGIAEFTFGQVIGLYRESALLEAIASVDGRSIAPLRNINLDYICDLRNEAVHNGAEFEPEDYDIQSLLSSLKVYLLFFGVHVQEPKSSSTPKTVSELSGMLQDMFSSVEIIEGTPAFYARLLEIISRPEIDTFDLTYLVENSPRHGRAPKSSSSEYFRLAREKVLRGDVRLRRIVTFNNEAKSAWILFNLVAAHEDVFDSDIRLAFFDAKKHSGPSTILIPNIALYYSSQDITDGFAWIYSTQEDDNQNFIGLSGKAVFPTIRRIYGNWFRSCEALSEARAQSMYIEIFGKPKSIDDIRSLARKFRDSILLDDALLERAVLYWGRRFGLD